MASVFEKASIVKECAKNLSTVYEVQKNADSALKYFKIYFAITDSLKTESQLRGIAQKEFICFAIPIRSCRLLLAQEEPRGGV